MKTKYAIRSLNPVNFRDQDVYFWWNGTTWGYDSNRKVWNTMLGAQREINRYVRKLGVWRYEDAVLVEVEA